MSYSQPILDAIERLKNFYNSNAFNAGTNPGGFANDGHQVNFPASLDDVSDVGAAVGAAADAAALSETATGEDRVQTGLDATATGQDRIATGLDATAAGQDRIATGLDATATGQDRIATGLDATATGQDRIATGLDATATGQDRIATGIDATATDQDRIKAQKWADEIEDIEVEAGKYSSKHHAAKAAASEGNAAATLADAAKKSDNLSDLASAPTAFGNIKQVATETATGVVEIATQDEVDAGTDDTRTVTPFALANWSGGAGKNDALFALEIADLKGDRMGMVDGLADPFGDETDVDTGASINESYDAINDWYSSTAADNDAFTTVLLHFDGTDASTTFTDDNAGGSAKTWTAAGNAQLDTGISPKFGTASALFDGTDDAIRAADHADFTLAAGDFTIDCRFYVSGGAGASRFVWGQSDSGAGAATTSTRVGLNTSNQLVAGAFVGSTLFSVTSTTTFTAAGWHHLAFVRTGDTLKLFIDGVQEGGDVAITGSINDSANQFAIGALGELTVQTWNGLIDEFRYSVGVARWTSNFTPPTAAYNSVSLNMTLVSNAFTATVQPDVGRLAVQVVENEAATANVDFTGEVSRDGGTTWTVAVLVLAATTGSYKLYQDNTINLSGQPPGVALMYRLKTLNQKAIDLTGVVLQWS